jgi:glycine oxidase
MLTPDGAQTSTSIASRSISVIGAGIAGTWQALLFAKAGRQVALYERDEPAMTQSTSHWAGGMLAPHCESEAAEPVITRLGVRSLDLWREALPDTPFNGSLVVAHGRDRSDYEAGLMGPRDFASPSTPVVGTPFWHAVS